MWIVSFSSKNNRRVLYSTDEKGIYPDRRWRYVEEHLDEPDKDTPSENIVNASEEIYQGLRFEIDMFQTDIT